MEVKISKQERLLRAELGQWEKDFYLKNTKVATQEDKTACLHAKALRNKLKYAKAILMKVRNKKYKLLNVHILVLISYKIDRA